jgi:SAM-dependent methyltransferase
MTAIATELDRRARQSLGRSDSAIHDVVARVLVEQNATGTLADVGCGTGELWRALRDRFTRGIGFDAVRYGGLPDDLEFCIADLDAARLPIPDASVDVAAAVEVIEHLENPRAFVRELVRIVRPGGWVVVTTPNQLSVLSLLTLVLKSRFNAFQDAAYPAHRTALLEVDLCRIARECRLREVRIEYTHQGRVPLTARHYPTALARLAPKRLSDNVVLIARR